MEKESFCPFHAEEEPQMLLRETIHKTKDFLHKTLKNFKAFFFGGYQRLPRSLSFNPFSCGVNGNARTFTRDQFYNEFYDQLQSDLNRFKRTDHSNNSLSDSMEKPPTMEDDASCAESFMSFQKKTHEERSKSKHKGSSQNGKKGDFKPQDMNNGGANNVLVQKMKELEMIDAAGDVEQVLDIEEALHYYSRLTSPVYIDIVDKFFVDMHSDFSTPQPSSSIKNSKGRLDSIRL